MRPSSVTRRTWAEHRTPDARASAHPTDCARRPPSRCASTSHRARQRDSKCEICGNEYDKSFEVIKSGQRHVFDSMECAIQGIAPVCDFCGVRIVGHGMEARGKFYCCAHCAKSSGQPQMKDRVA